MLKDPISYFVSGRPSHKSTFYRTVLWMIPRVVSVLPTPSVKACCILQNLPETNTFWESSRWNPS